MMGHERLDRWALTSSGVRLPVILRLILLLLDTLALARFGSSSRGLGLSLVDIAPTLVESLLHGDTIAVELGLDTRELFLELGIALQEIIDSCVVAVGALRFGRLEFRQIEEPEDDSVIVEYGLEVLLLVDVRPGNILCYGQTLMNPLADCL